MKVKLVLFGEQGINAVLIQFVEGTTRIIGVDDWRCIDLIVPRYDNDDVVLESDYSV